jgi:hypothetical protein
MKQCTKCGEPKPLTAFERLSSGGYRGTCRSCRSAAQAAAVRASPAYLARLERLERLEQKRSEVAAQREAERQARAAQRIAERTTARAEAAVQLEAERQARAAQRIAERVARAAQLEAERAEAEYLTRQAQQEREEQRRDDIWSAMRTGRSRRSASAVLPRPTTTHRIKLKDSAGGGYITAGEFACRCEERTATSRALKSCKTPKAAHAAMRVLEQGTASGERRRALRDLWQVASDTGPQAEDIDADPFADAFGDWAPAWMGDHTPPSVHA